MPHDTLIEEIVSLTVDSMERWTFEYSGAEILEAATREADHHRSRMEYWREKGKKASDQFAEAQSLDPNYDPMMRGSSSRQGYAYAVEVQMQTAEQKVREHQDRVLYFDRIARVMGREPQRKFKLTLENIDLLKL